MASTGPWACLPLHIVVAACLLAPTTLVASDDTSEQEPEPPQYSYAAANNEWLMFLTAVGGSSQYEYRLFGDGRLKWEHVHPQTRTIYDEGYVTLSRSEVASLYEFVVASGLVDVTRENWAEKIGVQGGVKDGSTIVLLVKFESYVSEERSEPEPFTQKLVVEDAPWMLRVNPELREVRTLVELFTFVSDVAKGDDSGEE